MLQDSYETVTQTDFQQYLTYLKEGTLYAQLAKLLNSPEGREAFRKRSSKPRKSSNSLVRTYLFNHIK